MNQKQMRETANTGTEQYGSRFYQEIEQVIVTPTPYTHLESVYGEGAKIPMVRVAYYREVRHAGRTRPAECTDVRFFAFPDNTPLEIMGRSTAENMGDFDVTQWVGDAVVRPNNNPALYADFAAWSDSAERHAEN